MATESPLAGLAQLLTTVAGSNRSSTTNPGDISYLQQVFNQGQQFNPQQMLQTIFQQASGQIPGFQRSFGNAVGARSGNNSAVAAVLQKLLQDTSVAAQQQMSNQVLQNNQQQGQVAGSIANATRGTQTTEKSGANLGNLAKILGVMQVSGKLGLTDQLGKMLGVGGTSGGGASSGMTGAQAIQQANQQMAPAAVSSPVSQSVPVGTALGAAGAADLGGVFSQPGMGSMDWTGGAALADGFANFSDMFAGQANALADTAGIDPMDALMGVTDGFGTIAEGGGSFIEDLLGGISGWLGFADGGLVGRDGEKEAKKSNPDEEVIENSAKRRFEPGNTNNQALAILQAMLTAPGFADGGPVRGNRPVNTTQNANPITMGAVNGPAPQATAAPQQQMQQPQVGAPGGVGSTTTGISLNSINNGGLGEMGAGLSPGGTSGLSSGQAAAVAAVAGLLGGPAMGLAVNGMLSPNATPGSVLGTNLGAVLGVPALAVNAINNTLNPTPATAAPATGGGFNSTANLGISDPGVTSDLGVTSQGVTSNDIGPGIDIGELGFDIGDGFGGGAGSSSGGTDGVGDAASAGVGGGGFKNGGEVNGPGTGTSDSIFAKLSDGEYVIPADVVDQVGVDFFDMLRAALHQPANAMR